MKVSKETKLFLGAGDALWDGSDWWLGVVTHCHVHVSSWRVVAVERIGDDPVLYSRWAWVAEGSGPTRRGARGKG